MRYNFYEILGVEKETSIEEIAIALNNKLEELKDTKDIRLWNYLLRTASELQIQIDKEKIESGQEEVSKEFYSILGTTPDISTEELVALLKQKYKDPKVLANTRVWNILHRESQKLGINACDLNEVQDVDGIKRSK